MKLSAPAGQQEPGRVDALNSQCDTTTVSLLTATLNHLELNCFLLLLMEKITHDYVHLWDGTYKLYQSKWLKVFLLSSIL